MKLTLHTLGGLAITTRDGSAVQATPKRLALLALLSSAGTSGLSRDKVVGLLSPDSTDENARHALEQLLYGLRRDLGDQLLLGPNPLRVNRALLETDSVTFEELLARGAHAEAAAIYDGPYLDGFYLSSAADFERWCEAERERLARQFRSAAEHLAAAATRRGDHAAAADWWRRFMASDPLSARALIGLMQALAAQGDRVAAMQHAATYEQLVRSEWGAEPEPEVLQLVEVLRRGGNGSGTIPTVNGVVSIQASETVADRVPDREPARTSGRLIPRLLAGTLAAVVIAVLWRTAQSSDRVSTGFGGDAMLVVPFSVRGADSSLAFLRDGLVELLATTLTGEGGPRAIDPRTALAALKGPGGNSGQDLDRVTVAAVAHRLRAKWILEGAAVGRADHLILSASIVDVGRQLTTARASVEGSADSLSSLVDQLAARLLTRFSAEPRYRVEHAVSASLPAVRAYLDGRTAYRHGRYDDAVAHFQNALRHDSAFALAGLQMAVAAGWSAYHGAMTRVGLDMAWAHRDRLSTRDAAILTARAGPRYPRPESDLEALTSWRKVVDLTPDLAEGWFWVGDSYFHRGTAMGIPEAPRRATEAFQRAATLDSSDATPLLHLMELAISTGDTASVRRFGARYLESSSHADIADFVRWRLTVGLAAQEQGLREWRTAYSTMTMSSLLRILVVMQDDGMPSHEADRVVAAMRMPERWRTDVTLVEAVSSFLLNAGRPEAAAAVTRSADPSPSSPIWSLSRLVGDALFSDGSFSAARDAAAELENVARRPLPGDDDARGVWYAARCASSLWRLSRADTVGLGRSIRELRAAHVSYDSLGVTISGPLCALALEAGITESRLPARANGALEQLDSLMLTGPVSFPVTWVGGLNVLLARLFETRGEHARALTAVRRRSVGAAWSTRFVGSSLLMEARLAERIGDSAGAARAYRAYLNLRSAPERTLQPQADSARTELRRLAVR